jgi:hypothetical protein
VVIALTLLMVLTHLANARETVNTIIDRGFIAHWLVCGPFKSDVPGGILGALTSDAPVLGGTDYMATTSGIARIRPQHLMRIPTAEGGEAIWQQAGTPEAELDLKPFFPASPDGVAYAAFYANATQNTAVFLDIQSPLGVRLWANGFPVQDYQPAPFKEAGVTQVAIPMRAGLNLVVMEVPGADYEAMAQALDMTTQQLTASAMANRPRLRKTSGFALSVLVRAARPLGKLFVVPDLEDAGTFSGAPGDERQNAWLTLYNPQDAFSEPIDVIVSTPGSSLPDLIEVEPIDPQSALRVPVNLPIQGLPSGEALSVSVRLHSAGSEAAFTDALVVRPGTDQPGIVRVITGHTSEIDDESIGYSEHIETIRTQLLTWQEAAGYGFDLRYASDWYVPFVALPEVRDTLLTAAQQGGATVRAGYAPVDERMVGGTLLWRNLQMGMGMDRAILESATPHHVPWDAPGIAPQTPQLLNSTPMKGFISNADAAGLSPLARQLDLGGTGTLHRHKSSDASPGSAVDLQEMAAVQRRELLALGIPTDVLVLKNVVTPPEPFYRGSVANLAKAFPRIVLNDGGGGSFFEEVSALEAPVLQALPTSTVYLNQGQPGDLLAWPPLKSAHARAAQQLLTAEALASLASLQGADYPHAAMDLANRQLAYYSTPSYLAAPATRDDALDVLAGYREVAELTEDTARRSLAYLADKIDTSGSVPLNQGEFQAIVVFNPLGQRAILPVEVALPAGGNGTFTLLDTAGAPVPHTVRAYQQAPLLAFMAADVPSFGYQTYFVKPEGTRSAPVAGADLQIENESIALFVDPDTGAIASLTDKRSGRELGGGLLNQIVFLGEDESQNQEGRELWTGPAREAPPRPTRIESEHATFRESIIVTSEVGGGTLVQRYTLNAGQPWVNCETTLSGVRLNDSAAFASFQFPDAGRSLLIGERFGAIVGARGHGDDTIRTHGSDYEGRTVAYPAHEWVAVAPGDVIQVGSDGVVPWAPAILVHGADPILEQAARELQAALYARGIPSILHLDQPTKPDFLWTDGTTEMDSNEYLSKGYGLRVVIGSPDQNSFCKGLLNQLTGEQVAGFNERIPQGARLLMEDTRVPDGIAPVPTLLVAGLTPTQSAGLAATITKALAAGQRYLMPPSASVIRRPAQAAEGGAAISFPGSMSVSQQRDGRLLLGLAHRSGLEDTPSGARLARLMGDLEFRYAIHPFEGDWRTADVPSLAEVAHGKVIAAVTGIHPGSLPATVSFLGSSAPGLRLAGLRPSGFPQTTNSRAPFHPRNGFSVLAWESVGQAWRGNLSSAANFLEARRADVYDAAGEPLDIAEGEAAYEARPFQVQPLWFLPAAQARRDTLAVLGRDADPHGTIHTRYWEERRGAAPQQNLPLGVLLRGSLDTTPPMVEVVISNHLTDQPIEGMAILSASSGVTFGPQQFFFSLTPGRQHVENVEVAFTDNADGDRAIAVEASFERQTYRDVLMSNEAPYGVVLTRNGAQLRAEIRNESGIHAQGYLDIIASPNHWSELGGFPAVTVMPRRAAVSVPPYKAQTIIFTMSDPNAALEACVKLAANGKVLYQFFDSDEERPAAASPVTAPATTSTNRATPVPPPPRGR